MTRLGRFALACSSPWAPSPASITVWPAGPSTTLIICADAWRVVDCQDGSHDYLPSVFLLWETIDRSSRRQALRRAGSAAKSLLKLRSGRSGGLLDLRSSPLKAAAEPRSHPPCRRRNNRFPACPDAERHPGSVINSTDRSDAAVRREPQQPPMLVRTIRHAPPHVTGWVRTSRLQITHPDTFFTPSGLPNC